MKGRASYNYNWHNGNGLTLSIREFSTPHPFLNDSNCCHKSQSIENVTDIVLRVEQHGRLLLVLHFQESSNLLERRALILAPDRISLIPDNNN